MTVMSYRDHLDFGIVTDAGQIPDAWPFMAHLRQALDDMESALDRSGRTVRRRPAPRSARAARA
jgi:hypothetical protein